MESCCRLCLNKNLDELESSVFLNNLQYRVKVCVNITITEYDELPTVLCKHCINKINEWYEFRLDCQGYDEILKRKLYKIQNNLPEIEETGNIYDCTICKQQFDTLFGYLDHQNEHNGQPVFKCDYCPEVLDHRDKLVQHENNHTEFCPKCSLKILKSSMKLHLNQHTDRYRCDQCNKCFNSNAILLQHITAVHTDRKDYICDTCGKGFSTKTSLIVHSRSHSNQRLYKCNLCNYAGRTSSALYIHKAIHSNETCICEICSKLFKSLRNLNDHKRRVHCKEKKHKCTYCDKRFVDKYMLTVHLRSHTGNKPYNCNQCNKKFVRSDSLKQHMLTHIEQQFECVKCKKRFASKKSRKRHNCTTNC